MNKIKIILLTLPEFSFRLYNMYPLISLLSLSGFSFEIFNGINGKYLSFSTTSNPCIQIINNIYSFNKDIKKHIDGSEMSLGELGCALSHIKIYEKLLSDDSYDSYLILEDDAILNSSLFDFLSFIYNIPNNFDICHLAKSDFFPFNKINKINQYFYTTDHNYFNRTTSYIISKSGASKILSYINNNVNLPSDNLLWFCKNNIENFNFYVPEFFLFREYNGNYRVSTISLIDNKHTLQTPYYSNWLNLDDLHL